MKPKIGIIASLFTEPHFHLLQNTVGYDYIHSVEAAGGIPIIIPVIDQDELLEQYTSMCDGFLFCGGMDLNPITYGEEPQEKLGSTNLLYDNFQLHLLEKIRSAQKPFLGICRGVQLMNVALGGTLYQDVSLQSDATFKHFQSEQERYGISHKVRIKEGTRLYSMFGSELYTNSFHHQTLHELGEHLIISATTSDGTIEAVETDDHPFQVGVQWHPENFIQVSDQMLPLFQGLVEAAQKN